MGDSTFYRRVVALGAAALLVFLVWQVLQSLAAALVWAMLLGSLLFPVHRSMRDRFDGHSGTAALAVTAGVLFCIALPLGLFGAFFVRQAVELGGVLGAAIHKAQTGQAQVFSWSSGLAAWLRDVLHLQPETLLEKLTESLATGLRFLAGGLGTVFVGAVDAVGSLALTLFALYFVLRDGERMIEHALVLVPAQSVTDARHLMAHMASVARAVVVGTLGTAAIQGGLVGLAFAVTRLPFAAVFGVVAALVSVLPVGGTALVWVPASVVMLLQGRYVAAGFMLAWGVFVVSTVDNFVRPRLMVGRAHVPTLAAFVGILGGIAAFGLLGLFLGPIVLSSAIELLRMIRARQKPDASSGGLASRTDIGPAPPAPAGPPVQPPSQPP